MQDLQQGNSFIYLFLSSNRNKSAVSDVSSAADSSSLSSHLDLINQPSTKVMISVAHRNTNNGFDIISFSDWPASCLGNVPRCASNTITSEQQAGLPGAAVRAQ